MRINLDQIEEYDVGNLNDIRNACEEERQKIHALKSAAEIIVRNIEVAERYFTNENMERAKRIHKEYIARLELGEKEIVDLLASVDEFAERLNKAWNSEW